MYIVQSTLYTFKYLSNRWTCVRVCVVWKAVWWQATERVEDRAQDDLDTVIFFIEGSLAKFVNNIELRKKI